MFRDKRFVMNIITVCGLHESGHFAAMQLCGVRVREIRFSGTGIRIITRKSGAEPLVKSLFVLLSGPAVNILMYMLLKERLPDTALMSLGAGIYNLLPYSCLDGGAVLELLILGNIHERRLRLILKTARGVLVFISAVFLYIYGAEAAELFIVLALLYIRNEYLPEV